MDQIAHQRLTRSCIQCLLADWFQLIALPEISRKSDHLLNAPLLFQVGDANAGIHPTGIGKNHFVGAAHQRDS